MGLKIEKVTSRKYKLIEDITVTYQGRRITVKKGFIFDGASIPRALWWFGSPFTGRYTKAALIHDALYASESFTRRVNDKIFKYIMELDGVGWTRRNLMYQSVRRLGWYVYRSHTPKSIANALCYIEISEVNYEKR